MLRSIAQHSRNRRRTRRLHIETLEHRTLLAADGAERLVGVGVGVEVVGCTLHIQGTEEVDEVEIIRLGKEIFVRASFLPAGSRRLSFDASLIDLIEVFTHGDNDSIKVELAIPPDGMGPAPTCGTHHRLAVHSGAGGDQMLLTMHPDATASREQKVQPIDIFVDLGSGDDLIQSRITDLVVSDLSFDVFGGDGRDALDFVYRNNSYERFVQKVHGGEGDDHIVIERSAESAGSAALVVEGNDGDDRIQELSHQHAVATNDEHMIDGGHGNDHIAARLRANTAETLNITQHGGMGHDSIKLLDIGGAYRSASLEQDGGDDNDVQKLNLFQTDYQSLRLLMKGGSGDDRVRLQHAPAASAIPGLDLKTDVGVHGDAGNDSIDVKLGQVIGPTIIVIQGGEDTDDIDFVAIDWALLSVAAIMIDGGGGLDIITVSLKRMFLSGGTLHLNVNGNDGDDFVLVRVEFTSSSIGTFDGAIAGDDDDDLMALMVVAPPGVLLSPPALLDGGNDFDECVVSPNVTMVNCELF